MKNNGRVYAEVDAILNLMDSKYVEMVPKKLREIFKNQKDVNYKPKIDSKKNLNEQNLERETLVTLAVLNLNYWCESEEEKQELIKNYSENEKVKEAEIREKYNPDNLFKDKNKFQLEEKENQKENQKELQMVEYRENIFRKLWKKLKKFFTK
ncbi:MAG: hypothetical protein J6K42_03905 [Clostridia bacterium]|nr:hypothetical protein [Clostridia bacterium]